jgi:hypothetical protein
MKRLLRLISAIGLLAFAQMALASTWGASQRLTWNSGVSECPSVAVNAAGHIFMVWHDSTSGTSGSYEIYFKKSVNGGASWSANQRLTWTSAQSKNPAIAIDGWGYIHLAWQESTPGNTEIYYKKSTNGGTSWTANQPLTANSGISECPAIAVNSAGHVYVVWHDNASGNYEIYYKKSANNGVSWSAIKRLTWNGGISKNPSIAIDGSDYVHIAWDDSTPGNCEIFFKKSVNGGTTWTANRRLTWNGGESIRPVLAVDSTDDLHVVWQDGTPGNREIYHKRSADGGATWTANRRLTYTAQDSVKPAIGVDSSAGIHLVWQEYTSSYPEVFYKNSTNGGVAWGANNRLTYTAGNTTEPSVAADSAGHVYAVWDDSTPGNYEIYARKGTTVSLTPITAYSSYDNYVSYSSADPNVANTVFASGDLPVGINYFYTFIGTWDFLWWSSALKFDVQSQIAGRNISKATLRLYVYMLRGEFSITPQIQMNAIASDWNPNTLTYHVYENMQIYLDGQVVKDAPVSAVVPFDFDVTYIVQQWASGNWPNYGFLLQPLNHVNLYTNSLQATSFQSLEYYNNSNQRPQLLIEFQ